jgi:hypothetical protein
VKGKKRGRGPLGRVRGVGEGKQTIGFLFGRGGQRCGVAERGLSTNLYNLGNNITDRGGIDLIQTEAVKQGG